MAIKCNIFKTFHSMNAKLMSAILGAKLWKYSLHDSGDHGCLHTS